MNTPATETPGDISPKLHLRVFTFGRFQLKWVDPETGQITSFPPERLRGQNAGSALGLFKALLSCPGRFATRAWLSEQFWPDSTVKRAEERLNDVVSSLRTLLRPQGSTEMLVHFVYGISGRGAGYRLDSYPQLWCDADAFEWYVKHALLLDQRGQDATACWERAYALAERGMYLPEQIEEDWSRSRRDYLNSLVRDSVHRWTTILRQMGHVDEAILRLRSYWLEHPTDEDALRPLLDMLGECGRFGEAEECYAKASAALAEESHIPDDRTKETIEVVRGLQVKRPKGTIRPQKGILQLPQDSSFSLEQVFFVSSIFEQQAHLYSPSQDDYAFRRVIDLAGSHSAVPFAQLPISPTEVLERLSHALAKPAQLDDASLFALEAVVRDCWRLRPDILGVMIMPNVLQRVLEHLRQVTLLLSGSLLASTRTRLCALASELTQIAGWTLYEMRAFSQAQAYYKMALLAAREAEQPVLEAITLARMSRIFKYCAQEENILPSLQYARHLLHDQQKSPMYSWLCAEEALAHAREGSAYESLKTLEQVTEVFQPEQRDNDPYWVGFEENVKTGFFGSCYLALQQPEQAEIWYRKALAQIRLTSRINPNHRRSLLSINLATIVLQQGALEEACQLAKEALLVLSQSQSPLVLQHLIKFRRGLEPWKSQAAVETFDTAFMQIRASLRKHESTIGREEQFVGRDQNLSDWSQRSS